MHRPGAAERDEREVARLDALLDGQGADRLRHLGVRDVADALGELARRRCPARRRASAIAVRAASTSSVIAPAGEARARPRGRARRFASVTVGWVPPRAVARRARVGARALRARRAGRRPRRRRSSRRRPRSCGCSTTGISSGKPSSSASDGHVGLPVDDERDVEARPAHVDADQVRAVRAVAPARRRPSCRRPGPESSVCSVSSRADSAVTMPPLDCITCSGTASPRVCSSDSSRSR